MRLAAECASPHRQFDVAETAFVLLANRLTAPRSEHGLARWLETFYVPDRHGRRWLPDLVPAEEATPEQRVRVEDRQLAVWYRTLDALRAARQAIETALYVRVRDLFSLKVDLVLYDVTNAYFARRSPKGTLRRHGNSKDGKSRNVLVVLGVVLANGWPIAHHLFPGNTADKKTFRTVVEDLEGRFGLRRVLVVGDAGLVSPENLTFLSTPGREVRYLVIESDERKAYEQELRQRDMDRTAEALRAIEEAVRAGRLKEPEKTGARAARALADHHGSRYYTWSLAPDGGFRFAEDPAKLAAETLREGRYLIKTNDPQLRPEESVDAYKQLSDVEAAYRDLKDVIAVRPVYHKSDARVEAHIFVATLALFLKRTLERHLGEKGIYLSATEAIAAMASLGVSVLDFDGQTRFLVGAGSRDARRVVHALGIKDINPPRPALEATRTWQTAHR